MDNTLYYGDNLDILRRYIKDESIDLIYLDPPFQSGKNYNVLFEEKNGSKSTAQIKVFEDTWHWDKSAAIAYEEAVEYGGRISLAMQALRKALGENDLMAYLAMMAPRLTELRRALKPTGSIYLHCDPTASHYLKILMDAVFGPRNYKNEIVWCYEDIGGKAVNYFKRKHNIIFFYQKSDKLCPFNIQYKPLSESTIKRYGPYFNENGQITYRRLKETNPGVLKKLKGIPDNLDLVWLDKNKGQPWGDWWADVSAIRRGFKESLNYPTQKPEALLERIICASSNDGDIVLDPFCGCGTTIAVAHRLNRKWIGIDITHLAISLMKHRLYDAFGDETSYQVIGEPVALSGAEALAKEDPYQFQWWALGLANARPIEQKKGADKGIDGRKYFHDEPKGGKTKQIIFSVKSGHITRAHIHELRGVIDREKAQIGVFICLNKPTKPMKAEAASADFYESPWGKHPRIQILMIEELLEGKKVDYPHLRELDATFKKAPKAKKDKPKHGELPLDD